MRSLMLRIPFHLRRRINAHHNRTVSKSIVSYTRLGSIVSVFSLVAAAMPQLPPTFDDADRTVPPAALPGTPDLYSLPYPRLNLTDGSAGSDIDVSSKYNTVSYSASRIQTAAALKEKYPQ